MGLDSLACYYVLILFLLTIRCPISAKIIAGNHRRQPIPETDNPTNPGEDLEKTRSPEKDVPEAANLKLKLAGQSYRCKKKLKAKIRSRRLEDPVSHVSIY